MHGFFKKGAPDEIATRDPVHAQGVERVIRYAFELARTRDRGPS